MKCRMCLTFRMSLCLVPDLPDESVPMVVHVPDFPDESVLCA